MRYIKFVLWGMVAATAATMAYIYVVDDKISTQSRQVTAVKLGDEFSLVRHDGKSITDKDLLGKPHALFFGFTNCPEVCPTTLHEMSTWLGELGEDANQINIYFMTVDPERDNVETLSDYLTAFDSRITGITGEKADVEKTLKSYKVFFRRVDLDDGDYSMDHSAMIYLLDAKGDFAGSISYGEDGQSAVAKLRKMLN
ncbi:MAG: SCO family protein [Hyphomicrobiales bacterium]|nr:SCO family protein [Hyphomicrobiales bacterium]